MLNLINIFQWQISLLVNQFSEKNKALKFVVRGNSSIRSTVIQPKTQTEWPAGFSSLSFRVELARLNFLSSPPGFDLCFGGRVRGKGKGPGSLTDHREW